MDEELRKDLFGALSGIDGGNDIYDKVLNSVNSLKSKANTEKTLGVKTKTKLDELQGTLDAVNASLMGIGFDPEGEGGLDSFLSGLAKVKPGKDGKPDFDIEKSPAFMKLKKQNDTLAKQLTEYEGRIKKADTEKANNTIRSTLTSAFKNDSGDFTHYGTESRIENLVLTGALSVGENGAVVWNNPEDTDNPIDFDSGFKSYLDKPDVKRDLRDVQKPGGNSTPKPGAPGKKAGEMSDAERIQHINKQAKGFSFVK